MNENRIILDDKALVISMNLMLKQLKNVIAHPMQYGKKAKIAKVMKNCCEKFAKNPDSFRQSFENGEDFITMNLSNESGIEIFFSLSSKITGYMLVKNGDKSYECKTKMDIDGNVKSITLEDLTIKKPNIKK